MKSITLTTCKEFPTSIMKRGDIVEDVVLYNRGIVMETMPLLNGEVYYRVFWYKEYVFEEILSGLYLRIICEKKD